MRMLPTTKPYLWGCLLALTASAANGADMPPEDPPVSELHCVVMPSAVVDVASGVSGRVDEVNVERGDRVEAGQLVAALDSGVEQANLVLARARAELEADIHLRQVRLDFEERNRQRTERLHSNRVVSARERDEAKTDAVLASWQLRQAIDNQHLAQLELDRAEQVLKRRQVHSPIGGVVVERFKWPGEYVEEDAIVRVARLDPLWVEVVVPVALNGKISKNMLAEVITETDSDQYHEARVTVIDPMGDAASGTFRVRLELPNPDLALFGGVKCKARFPEPARFLPEPESPVETPHPSVPAEPLPSQDPGAGQQSVSVDATPADEPLPRPLAADQASNGFIVLTPSLDSRDESRALRARLRDAGVRDFLTMGKGPYAGRISLGVYDRQHMAERRVSQLSRLGFETYAVPRQSGEVRLQANVRPVPSDTAG